MRVGSEYPSPANAPVPAVIVPTPGADFDADAVVAYLRDRLADFKVPQFYAVATQPLPRNPGGKILKRQLRESTTWGPPAFGR